MAHGLECARGAMTTRREDPVDGTAAWRRAAFTVVYMPMFSLSFPV